MISYQVNPFLVVPHSMDIQEFLEQCVGNWFSQRSSYHFEAQQGTSDKSELAVEWLTSEDAAVVELCKTHNIDPQTSLGGQKVSWDTSCDWGKPKKMGSGLTIFVPNSPDSSEGKLLSNPNDTMGGYKLGNDQSLHLTLSSADLSIQERIWFVSPNLRFRTSLIKGDKGFNRTAFYSEIRKLPAKE
ncbi:MAG: phycobiliprotein lyase [Microcystaceae cyanobacterium]